MASSIQEVTKNTAQYLLELISQTSENLRMMEVAEYFDPIQELGAGGYGNVLLAKHRSSGQLVAVKLQSKEKVLMDDFLMEHAISFSLSCHQNIIMTHEIAFHTSRDFVFIQKVAPAGDLLSMIKPNVGLNEVLVKRCVPQIASALDFMHSKGMVHCDLKLDNILLMDFECHVIKVADFGLTKLQGTQAPLMSWFLPNTAPELCSLKQGDHLELQPSIDVWAFGVLVYSVLTGYFPWEGAVGYDQLYRDFAWWQLRKDLTLAPSTWRKFSLEARQMFWDMLALNAAERCSAIDIAKYIHLPWNIEAPPENVTMNTGLLHTTDRAHKFHSGASSSVASCLLPDHEPTSLTIGDEMEIT